jgi:ribose 5-phosphate isomerase A
MINDLKKKAALHAVKLIESDMVLGLGSGSTTEFAIKEIARLLKVGALKEIVGIPSSAKTEQIARELMIPLTTFETHKSLDLTIDGADEVDPSLDLIKGGWGALLREKVLAQASIRTVIIVDESKLVDKLGSRWAVPVEVVPFAWQVEAGYIKSLGAQPKLRIDQQGQVFITDQNNYILDCNFGPIGNPKELSIQLNQRAGIIENGLFLGLATDVIIAGEEGLRHLRR